MDKFDPLSMTKEQYSSVIEKITLPHSPVGIDAQYTHAIIIEYLKQITARLDRLEAAIGTKTQGQP